MNKPTLIASVAIVAAAAAFAAIFWRRIAPQKPHGGEIETVSVADTPVAAAPAGRRERSGRRAQSGRVRAGGAIVASDAFAGFAPDEQRLCEDLDAAAGDGDYARTLALAQRAAASTNAEMRMAAVDALGWFGEKALVDLVSLMADRDGAVAAAALDVWEVGLMDVESASSRMDISRLVLGALTDHDTLASIGAQFVNAATECIDTADDEVAANAERIKAVQALVDMMGDETGARAQVARELYTDLTGFKWLGISEAERYLADPDEYDGDEQE